MSDDPLAGLRAHIQASRNHYSVISSLRSCGMESPSDNEPDLLAQIQRMAKTIATMQEQLIKVAMERDQAIRERNIPQEPVW
jgi:hypothetical protein